MIPEDLQTLNFDVAGRISSLRDVIDSVNEATSPDFAHYLAADIGGHPALLARSANFPVVTFDLPRRGPAGYVRGSGAGLPLRDKSIPIMVASDTLEHIPREFRDGFVDELTRCASEAVILSGPWNTPGVEEAEAAIRSVMPKSSAASRWLEEHHRYRLPDLALMIALFERQGFTVSVRPDGDLWEWFQLFLTENVLQGIPGFPACWDQWQQEWNGIPYSTAQAPGYRHILVACRKPVSLFPRFEIPDSLPSGFSERISAATSLAQLAQHQLQNVVCDNERSLAEFTRLFGKVTGTHNEHSTAEPSFFERWFR